MNFDKGDVRESPVLPTIKIIEPNKTVQPKISSKVENPVAQQLCVIQDPQTKLTELEKEINELLLGSSKECIDRYKAMEVSIRSAYEEISALTEYDTKLGNNQSQASLIPLIEEPKANHMFLTTEEMNLKIRNNRLQKKGVELTSNLFDYNKIGSGRIPYKTYPLTSLDDSAVQRVLKTPKDDICNPFKDISDIIDHKLSSHWRERSLYPPLIPMVPKAREKNTKSIENNQNMEELTMIIRPKKGKKKKPKKNPIKNDLIANSKRFPLEWFDNSIRTNDGSATYHLNLAQNRNERGTPAYSKYIHSLGLGENMEWKWEKCLILDYSHKKEQYLIEWEDRKCVKWVRRFNILLPGEKLGDLSLRMELCSKARSEYEQNIINQKLINDIPDETVRSYPAEYKYKILQRLGRPISIAERKIIVIYN
jgi:hypothetical protein